MNTDYDIENIFPRFLWYGELDPEKTRIEYKWGDKKHPIFIAAYRGRKGDLVYKLQVEKEPNLAGTACYVEELYNLETVERTWERDLESAFLKKSIRSKEHPRFRDMAARLQGRNIILHDPWAMGGRVYFPEGFMFTLRLPVIGRNRFEIIDELRNMPAPMKFEGFCQSMLLSAEQGGELVYSPLITSQFSASLRELEEAIEFLFDEGLVPYHPREFCLQVLTGTQAAPGSFPVYHYPIRGGAVSFGLLLDRDGEISIHEAEKMIENSTKPKNARRGE